MTFSELQEQIGTYHVQSDWRQTSGGGWIHVNAKVKNEANVMDNAIVYGDVEIFSEAEIYDNARVFGNARILGKNKIYGNAQVYGNAVFLDNAEAYDNARVFGNSEISGNAKICGNAMITGIAKVTGDAWNKSPLFVMDSLNRGYTNSKYGYLKIGCEEFPFDEWIARRDEALARHPHIQPDPQQYVEFEQLVTLFKAIGR